MAVDKITVPLVDLGVDTRTVEIGGSHQSVATLAGLDGAFADVVNIQPATDAAGLVVRHAGALEVVTPALDAAQDTVTTFQAEGDSYEINDSAERDYTHVTQLVTTAGDTLLYTPQAGRRVVLRWIYAVNNPGSTTYPVITIRLGAEDKFVAYALSKRQKVTGPIDGALSINLSTNASVAVTALVEEI